MYDAIKKKLSKSKKIYSINIITVKVHRKSVGKHLIQKPQWIKIYLSAINFPLSGYVETKTSAGIRYPPPPPPPPPRIAFSYSFKYYIIPS